jgi:PASTA domain-containing protein
MNQREATQLLERLGGMLDVSGAPVERVVDAGRQASRRRHRWQVGAIAAAVAVVAAAGGFIAQQSPQDNTAPPTSPTTVSTTQNRDGVLTPPPGTRLVGANGVVVAVPASFTTEDLPCGVPNSDTVTFRPDFKPKTVCSFGDPSAVLLEVIGTDSPLWRQLLDKPADEITVDGLPALRTQLECFVPESIDDCAGSLTFPTAGISFLVRTHRPEDGDETETETILDSARAVPSGYVTVPSVIAMQGGDAAAAIEAAGLTVDPGCSVPQCLSYASGTNPPAGTPLKSGSSVSLRLDGSLSEGPASEDDLVGTWRPGQIGTEHFSDVQRSFGEPVLLTFDHIYPWLGWRGYDGCNWASGRVHLDPTGSFATSQNSTTTRGCIGMRYRHPTIPEIVEGASIVTFGHHHLRFYDSDTRLLATFVRARSR